MLIDVSKAKYDSALGEARCPDKFPVVKSHGLGA